MQNTTHIRALEAADLPAVKAVIDACGLFPSEMMDGMTAEYLTGAADREIWLVAGENAPEAVAYCAPERMTDGTWNLLLIAVHPARQRKGYGAALLRRVEELLAACGGRVLLVETSGLPEFESTRGFYFRSGFAEEARIREFYQAGEDKIVFRKALR